MIVSPRGDRILMVRQVDHQAQCGAMARAWGHDMFARIDPWRPVETAAGCHDEGWRDLDEATEPGDAGAPLDFPRLDGPRHVAMYARGIAAAVAADPLAGYLVSMHGQGLHEARMGLDGVPRARDEQEPEVHAFVEEQERLRARIEADLADPGLAAWGWDGYRLLQAMDLLSLHLLWFGLPKGAPGTLARVPRRAGDPGVDIALTPLDAATCGMAPYPFAEPVLDLPVPARWIPNRRYAGPEDLRDELARAPWDTEHVRVRPA